MRISLIHCSWKFFLTSSLLIVNSSLYFIIHYIPAGTCQRFTFVLLYSMENRSELGRSRMYNSGGSRGEARGAPPSLFLDQTEARRAEKTFFDTAPLISGSGWVPHIRCWSKVFQSIHDICAILTSARFHPFL